MKSRGWINTYRSDLPPRSVSSCRGMAYRGSANCSCPRTASGRRGAARCDPPRSPWYSVPASCTPHTADGPGGNACSPSATCWCSPGCWQTVCPPGAGLYAPRSILFQVQSALRSQDVRTALSVFSAYETPPYRSMKKDTCQSLTDASCSFSSIFKDLWTILFLFG